MKKYFIKARSDGKIYNAEAGNIKLEPGDAILFESDQCQETAIVISEKEATSFGNETESGEIAFLIRRLNEKDLSADAERKDEARSNLIKCKEIVAKHDLPMEMLDANLSFDGKKLTFYFSAPGRVDFRSLVSELASTFQKLIRLQQVGARDRAKFSGGIGRCGQPFCCKRFLKGELDCVSIDMAYEQNLAQANPNRVSGACGKLMCCLKYELEFYQKAKKTLPAIGSEIKVDKGKGVVVSQNVVKHSVRVELADRTYLEVNCSK